MSSDPDSVRQAQEIQRQIYLRERAGMSSGGGISVRSASPEDKQEMIEMVRSGSYTENQLREAMNLPVLQFKTAFLSLIEEGKLRIVAGLVVEV